jgi:tetrahydromethanopterin S-methyltransferase subunit G
MSEAGDVLDFLRTRFPRLDDRLDHIGRKLDEVVTRLGALERKVAGIELDYAAIQKRLDNVDRRLDRIELASIWSTPLARPPRNTPAAGTVPGCGFRSSSSPAPTRSSNEAAVILAAVRAKPRGRRARCAMRRQVWQAR